MPVTNRKISVQINIEPIKNKKIQKTRTICTNDSKVKIKRNEIQKALSCDFNRRSPESEKEKTKKSISKGEGKLISEDTIQGKKNKSWNHFHGISSEISSKTFLAEKVLPEREKGKSLLGLNLSRKALKKIDCKALLINQTKDFNASAESSKKPYNNEQLLEKSLSYQHLQSPNRAMDACKSISFAGSLKKPDRNFNILQQYKNNLIDKQETLTKRYQIKSSVWDHMEPSDHLCNLRGLCKEKVTPVLNRCSLGTKPGWRCSLQPHNSVIAKVTNQSIEGLKNEIYKSDKGLSRNNVPVKMYNSQVWQQIPKMKKNLKICQCPHFHTEEGIKKVCLQSSPEEQEFGQKFFRVNYIPKEEVDDNDEEKEYVDKGTTTEDESVKSKPKIIKNESVRRIVCLKTKEPEIIKKDNYRNSKQKNTICHEKKCMHLTETPKYSAKSLKSSKQEEKEKEKKEKNLNGKAAIEAETLRKLFTKLKAVECRLKEENTPKNSKNVAEKNCQNEKVKEMSQTDEKDDFKVQNKELKAEIICHVQNWLDAEFKDS